MILTFWDFYSTINYNDDRLSSFKATSSGRGESKKSQIRKPRYKETLLGPEIPFSSAICNKR